MLGSSRSIHLYVQSMYFTLFQSIVQNVTCSLLVPFFCSGYWRFSPSPWWKESLSALVLCFALTAQLEAWISFLLQRSEPQQSAAATAAAPAWAAARHLPYSAVPPERQGHPATCCCPGRVTRHHLHRAMARERARRFSELAWACTRRHACRTAVYGMCVISGIYRSIHRHPVGSSFNFQSAQDHNFEPEVTTRNNLVGKKLKTKRKRKVAALLFTWTGISCSTLHEWTGRRHP